MTWQIVDSNYEQAKITVIGVGGGGGNSVNHMINAGIKGVDFICANTDSQDLTKTQKAKKIKLGESLTRGLGAGNDPQLGRQAAVESSAEIQEALKNTEMLFITAGMGGGTGTGGAPVIARIAKELGILTVAVVTTPFDTEGGLRAEQAGVGVANLTEQVDCLIEINNQKIFDIFPGDAKFIDGFNEVNEIIANAVRGVANVILNPATMNVDFADVKAAMSESGVAIMCIGKAKGLNRASNALTNALNNPFFDKAEIRNAKGLLVNICGSSDMKMEEINQILNEAKNIGLDGIQAIPGLTIDEAFEDEISVTIIATGLRRFNTKDFWDDDLGKLKPVKTFVPEIKHDNDGYINPMDLKKIDIQSVIRSIED
tara:strand:+ start:31426 stop:32538 length:1113 start_codon:yes stop_codon:yes gene_type:complete